MVETLRSLEMEREVGARLGEGELALLKIENQGKLGFGKNFLKQGVKNINF